MIESDFLYNVNIVSQEYIMTLITKKLTENRVRQLVIITLKLIFEKVLFENKAITLLKYQMIPIPSFSRIKD
jgi:hypothetical protein